MKVLKFGGSSVGTPQRIKNIISILQDYKKKKENFTVVFSAFSGVTDSLIEMAIKAAKGDKEYLDAYKAFHRRHLTAIKKLLSGTKAVSYTHLTLPTIYSV